MIKKFLNSKLNLDNSYCKIILVLFLYSSFINAQKRGNYTITEKPTVFLTNGSSLYSADEDFNNSVNLVVLKNDQIASQKNNSINVSQSTSSLKSKDVKNGGLQVENSADKELNKAIKKEIANHKKRKESFKKFDFDCVPSSSEFFSTDAASKNYIAPNFNGNDSLKLYTWDKDYSIKRALNFLHAKQFTYYNNKSLDYCFSQVFSVRPPPVLLV